MSSAYKKREIIMKKLHLQIVVIVIIMVKTAFGVAYLKNEKGDIYSMPNGVSIAEVTNQAPVRILERRNNWLKISVTGWIEKKSLDMSKDEAYKLEVVSFDREYRQGVYSVAMGRLERITNFKIKFKNTGKQLITDWSGKLIIKNNVYEVLYVSNIADKKAEWKSGEIRELEMDVRMFSFAKFNDYYFLESAKDEELILELMDVVVNTADKKGAKKGTK